MNHIISGALIVKRHIFSLDLPFFQSSWRFLEGTTEISLTKGEIPQNDRH